MRLICEAPHTSSAAYDDSIVFSQRSLRGHRRSERHINLALEALNRVLSRTSEKIALSNLVPKPCRIGAATGGPSLSCHLNFNTKPDRPRSIVQETVIFPATLDKAPCLAELV